MYTRRADLLNSLHRYASAIPTTQPSPTRIDVSLYALLYTLSLHMGGRAFGPPLCRGCAPATPPYKNMPHRPCVRFPSIVSGERSLLPHLPPQPTTHRSLGLVDVCLNNDFRVQITPDRRRAAQLRKENSIRLWCSPRPPRTKRCSSRPFALLRGSIGFVYFNIQARNIPNRPAGFQFLLTSEQPSQNVNGT